MKLHELAHFSDLVKEKNTYGNINDLANKMIKKIITIDSMLYHGLEPQIIDFINLMFSNQITEKKLNNDKIFMRRLSSTSTTHEKLRQEFLIAIKKILNQLFNMKTKI